MDQKVIFKFGIIFLISFIVSFLVQRYFNISMSQLRTFVESYGTLAPFAYSITLFLGLSVPFNPIPDFLVVNLAALLFAPVVSILATLLGHLSALTINYWIARNYGNDILKKVLNPREYTQVEKLSQRINLNLIFGFRFILPVTAIGIDFVSYAAGIAKLDFGKFLLVSLIPWTFYSIFYFFTTSYLKGINPLLIFLPAAIILGVPLVILALRKRETIKDKLRRFVRI